MARVGIESVLLVYRWVQTLARALAPAFGGGRSKVARGLAGRRDAHEVLARWGSTERDPGRPVVWVHAPSVGEGHVASAVIERLRLALPGLQVVYTFFSPSAEGPVRHMDTDVAAYLPWDLKRPMSLVLDTVRPDLLVFTRTEVWPVLVAQARARRIPVAIVGGVVPDDARRMRPLARHVLRATWHSVAFAGAVTPRDRERFVDLGVPEDHAFTTGDPAVDSALTRFDAVSPVGSPRAELPRDDLPTVVAGSTWPADERVLLPALRTVRAEEPRVRVVVAPHEPDDASIASLRGRLRADGWTVATLTELRSGAAGGDVTAIVVETVGDLAGLYGAACVSYVGGGFHAAGLHSVLEPAAAASPVVFGPRVHRSDAARALLAAGGAKIARDSDELARIVTSWLADRKKSKDVGRCARDYIERHAGAAETTAARVAHVLRARR